MIKSELRTALTDLLALLALPPGKEDLLSGLARQQLGRCAGLLGQALAEEGISPADVRTRAARPLAWLYDTYLQDGTLFSGASVERLTIGLGVPPGSTEIPLGPFLPGLPMAQSPDYTTDGLAIVSRRTGEAVPASEPLAILRASDPLARTALEAMVRSVAFGPQRDEASSRLAAFHRFASSRPDLVS